jgi:hypothetical protein
MRVCLGQKIVWVRRLFDTGKLAFARTATETWMVIALALIMVALGAKRR